VSEANDDRECSIVVWYYTVWRCGEYSSSTGYDPTTVSMGLYGSITLA